MKKTYFVPETNALDIRPQGCILALSDPPGGAQSTGFTNQGSYDDSDWDID